MEEEHFHVLLTSTTFAFVPKEVIATPSPSSAIIITIDPR